MNDKSTEAAPVPADPASDAFVNAVQSAQTKLTDLRASLKGKPFGGARLSIFATDLEALLTAACRAPTPANAPADQGVVERLRDIVQKADALWLARELDTISEAADTILALQAKITALVDGLAEARLQLEYLDGRFPTGTTPAAVAKIAALLDQHKDGGQ